MRIDVPEFLRVDIPGRWFSLLQAVFLATYVVAWIFGIVLLVHGLGTWEGKEFVSGLFILIVIYAIERMEVRPPNARRTRVLPSMRRIEGRHGQAQEARI